MAEKITFNECPFCGEDPEVLQQSVNDDHYFICSCKDTGCRGWNRETFDDAKSCAAWWNSAFDYLAVRKEEDDAE